DPFDDGSGRTFDREIGVGGHRVELDQRTGNTLRVKPSLRLGAIMRGGAGKREARHAFVEAARRHPADGTEASNGDPGHARASQMNVNASYAAVMEATRAGRAARHGGTLTVHSAQASVAQSEEDGDAQAHFGGKLHSVACNHTVRIGSNLS